jgi:hypothetical protein
MEHAGGVASSHSILVMYPAFQVCHGALDTSRHGWRLAVDNATITARRRTMLAAMSRRECSKNRNMYV